MDLYVNMIEQPARILFGLSSMIYRKTEFIEVKEIRSGAHIKKINAFHLTDQFKAFFLFSQFSFVAKGILREKQVPDPIMIQHRFGFFIKSSDAETARCPAKENLFLTLSERELNQLCPSITMTRVTNSLFCSTDVFGFLPHRKDPTSIDTHLFIPCICFSGIIDQIK